MDVEFDGEKARVKRAKHGISLAAADMDFDAALVMPDSRRDYGEPRFWTIGPIAGRLHVLAFMGGGTLRAISPRKANARERRRYERP